MSSDVSQLDNSINGRNITSIRYLIGRKKDSVPYYAIKSDARRCLTDHDVFPYPRYFTGIPTASFPVVAEREAGWRPRHENCYDFNINNKDIKKDDLKIIFEGPCSAVYPKYTDKDDQVINNVVLNKNCIVEYR